MYRTAVTGKNARMLALRTPWLMIRRILLGGLLVLFALQVVSAPLPMPAQDAMLEIEICGVDGMQTISPGPQDPSEHTAHLAKCPFCVVSVADTGVRTTPRQIALSLRPAVFVPETRLLLTEHPATSRTIRGPPLTI